MDLRFDFEASCRVLTHFSVSLQDDYHCPPILAGSRFVWDDDVLTGMVKESFRGFKKQYKVETSECHAQLKEKGDRTARRIRRRDTVS
jgi:hypothetical protein